MGGQAGQKAVLVVDDDASMRLLCRVNLELEGYRVLEAETAQRVRDQLRAEEIDVVLLDVHVGSDDGRAILEEVRATHPDVAVAFMTGTADPSDLTGIEADGVLGKPFAITDLSALVRRLASR
jgi:DNA-binding NtrC family response regulator